MVPYIQWTPSEMSLGFLRVYTFREVSGEHQNNSKPVFVRPLSTNIHSQGHVFLLLASAFWARFLSVGFHAPRFEHVFFHLVF